MGLLRDPACQWLRERRKVEIEMLGLFEDRRRSIDLRTGVDQLIRIELVPAVLALIATRILVPADRAGSLDVAVRKRSTGGRLERPHRRLLDQIALVVKR